MQKVTGSTPVTSTKKFKGHPESIRDNLHQKILHSRASGPAKSRVFTIKNAPVIPPMGDFIHIPQKSPEKRGKVH